MRWVDHWEMGAGLSYVRRHAWLWATLASAAIAYLLFMGPIEVLVPFIVKNELRGTAAELGLVFAAGGIGSVVCAVALSQNGLPKTPHSTAFQSRLGWIRLRESS